MGARIEDSRVAGRDHSGRFHSADTPNRPAIGAKPAHAVVRLVPALPPGPIAAATCCLGFT